MLRDHILLALSVTTLIYQERWRSNLKIYCLKKYNKKEVDFASTRIVINFTLQNSYHISNLNIYCLKKYNEKEADLSKLVRIVINFTLQNSYHRSGNFAIKLSQT